MVEPTAQGIFAQICENYLKHFPGERQRLKLLLYQIESKGEATVAARQRFDPGHATASGFIVDPAGSNVLLVEHLFLQRRLQPGGHMEPEDADPLQGAYREVKEEVGLDRDSFRYIPLDVAHKRTPFDIGVHPMPARPHKQEPPHHHYDFRYLFVLKKDAPITVRQAEVGGAHWISWAAFAAMPDFAHIAPKMKHLLQRK